PSYTPFHSGRYVSGSEAAPGGLNRIWCPCLQALEQCKAPASAMAFPSRCLQVESGEAHRKRLPCIYHGGAGRTRQTVSTCTTNTSPLHLTLEDFQWRTRGDATATQRANDYSEENHQQEGHHKRQHGRDKHSLEQESG